MKAKMDTEKNKIFAVTLNWNSYGDVVQCVENLKANEQKIDRVIIVDNGSTDGSGKRLVQEYSDDKIVGIVENATNEGFAGAVNKGMRIAIAEGATHVFLLNNDAVIDKRCLTLLLAALDGDKKAGAVGPTVFYKAQPKRIWYGAGYFSYLRANVVVPGKNTVISDVPGPAREVTFVSGCALLLKTSMLNDIGLFDTDFFFYGEDVEFSLRAVRRGYKLLYEPSAHAWHQIDDIATSRSSPYVMYHRARSSVKFLLKSFAWPYAVYAILLHFFLYTPFRLWQSRHNQRPMHSFKGWVRGTIHGLFYPSRNWIG
jgi:GT2 family glycosyltransferase